MMWRAWHLAVLWMLYAAVESQNRSGSRDQQSKPIQNNRRPPFKSWNSQMYPVWKGSEAQKRDCWKGGQVTFSLQNDAPTLTGAKATFFIQLNFPQNQTVLPDGQVVWSQNRTNNGTWDPVFPDETTEGSECTFPDGSPFPRNAEKRRSKFVYVWQAWGKYWQVVDGPSSNLTVETEGIPLGSYTMEVVVYHYRGRQKFIPIGTTSSQFVITDQIPVSVSISQVLDLDEEDQRFIQNRAVSFSVTVHDPSNYLKAADISFSWDFGDQSGTLITRNTAVTHTYVTRGVYKANVVVQATIPVTPCGGTVPVASTTRVIATTALPLASTTGAAASTEAPATSGSLTGAPGTTALPGNSTLPDETIAFMTVAAEVNVEAESVVQETEAESESVVQETEADVTENEETSPVAVDEVATDVLTNAEAVTPAEVLGTEVIQEAIPSEVAVLPEAVATDAAPDQEAVSSDIAPNQDAETVTQLTEGTEEEASLVTEAGEAITNADLSQAVTELNDAMMATEAGAEVLLLVKRQAPEGQFVGCLLYRYGTYAANLDIVSGIESVQIVQVEPIVSAELENTIDLTVTCQGSIPREACMVISGPDCETPQQTICNPVEPSTDCQLVLRQVFNDTGVFCVNVSLADDVSLAVASAQVNVLAGAASSVNGIAVTVGVLLAALAIATVAYTYRHVKSYTPLRSAHPTVNRLPDRSSVWLFIQNALGRSANGEHSPLLNSRVV